MDSSALDRTRAVSEALFGAKHRLPVSIEVGQGPEREIYAAKLASKVQASETQVGTELKRLAAIGLLQALPLAKSKRRGQPPQTYRRCESAYWGLALIHRCCPVVGVE
jgi:predicted ArsR family transcriptional regulator